jgi:hypothetical protein
MHAASRRLPPPELDLVNIKGSSCGQRNFIWLCDGGVSELFEG